MEVGEEQRAFQRKGPKRGYKGVFSYRDPRWGQLETEKYLAQEWGGEWWDAGEILARARWW